MLTSSWDLEPLDDTIQENNNTIIHPTALIHPKAQLGSQVTIGPYAIIGEHVSIGSNTTIGPHVVIEGWTSIGRFNEISTGAIIGNIPQDLKFQGEESYVCIGNYNKIREYATINRGTTGGGGITRVGDHNLIMTSAHVAHDVQMGNHNVIVNDVGIAGHVVIDDWVTIGFASGIHQFVKLGKMAMIGAGSIITKDTPPFALIQGNPPKLYGINLERLRRAGYSREAKKIIQQAYKILLKEGLTLQEAIESIELTYPNNNDIDCLIKFLRESQRGIYR